jgi:hypothetical protein
MNRIIKISTLCVIALVSVACTRSFDIETPDSFVELDEGRHSRYDYRATTADGVVISVRALENDRHGSTDFWAEAIRTKLRDGRGYALLEEEDITTRGYRGKQMRFGRDESGHTYRYWISLFVRDQGRNPMVWVIEAGGEQEAFEARQEEIEQLLGSFAPR